jgi:hypothetical protein
MAPWGGVPVACVLNTDCFSSVVVGDIPYNAKCLRVTGGLPEGVPSSTYCTCSLIDFQSGVGCDDNALPGAYVAYHVAVALLLLWFKLRIARTLFQGWRLGVLSLNAGIVVAAFALLSLLSLNTYLLLLLVQSLGMGTHSRVLMLVALPFARTASVGFYVSAMIIWRIEVQDLMARVHRERKASTQADKLLASLFVLASFALQFSLQFLGLETVLSGVVGVLVISCALVFVKVGFELRDYLGNSASGASTGVQNITSTFRRSVGPPPGAGAGAGAGAGGDGAAEPASAAAVAPAESAAGSAVGTVYAVAPLAGTSETCRGATDRVRRAVKRIEVTVAMTILATGLFMLLEALRLFGPDFRTSSLGPDLFFLGVTKITIAICGYGVYVSGAFGIGSLADKVGEQRQRRKTQVITFETELQLKEQGASSSALSLK